MISDIGETNGLSFLEERRITILVYKNRERFYLVIKELQEVQEQLESLNVFKDHVCANFRLVLEELSSCVINSPSIDTSLFEQAAADIVNITSSEFLDPYTSVLCPILTKLYVFHAESNLSASSPPPSINFHSVKQISPTVSKGRSGVDAGDCVS